MIFPLHFFIDFGTQNPAKMEPGPIKIRPKVDKTSQGTSKMLPRRSKTRLRGLQEAPKTPPRLLQTFQEAWRRLQKAPQTLPKPSKTCQESPQRLQEGYKSYILPFQFYLRILCYRKQQHDLSYFAFRPWILSWYPKKANAHWKQLWPIQCQHVADKQRHISNATDSATQQKSINHVIEI